MATPAARVRVIGWPAAGRRANQPGAFLQGRERHRPRRHCHRCRPPPPPPWKGAIVRARARRARADAGEGGLHVGSLASLGARPQSGVLHVSVESRLAAAP